NPIPILTPC
nr:RecName: Full=Methylated-DNA--protein-cysteine methyltransferase; AltName: Full=6-O-methylguanine-DNA methyltransferase; Short=MGMT; AltName: Full=O-6-methylguanine-DNA-alkyltransferase [Bos taurus]